MGASPAPPVSAGLGRPPGTGISGRGDRAIWRTSWPSAPPRRTSGVDQEVPLEVADFGFAGQEIDRPAVSGRPARFDPAPPGHGPARRSRPVGVRPAAGRGVDRVDAASGSYADGRTGRRSVSGARVSRPDSRPEGRSHPVAHALGIRNIRTQAACASGRPPAALRRPPGRPPGNISPAADAVGEVHEGVSSRACRRSRRRGPTSGRSPRLAGLLLRSQPPQPGPSAAARAQDQAPTRGRGGGFIVAGDVGRLCYAIRLSCDRRPSSPGPTSAPTRSQPCC